MVRPLAAGLVLMLAACERSGEVIVVLDSTMRGEGVEVVAFRTDGEDGDAAGRGSSDRSPSSQRAAMTPLDDSAAMLANRFREMRDSLNADVARLDSIDRRTRTYAVRYAEIRRRTVAAEQLRARRDSVMARAALLRATPSSAPSSRAPVSGGDSLSGLEGLPDVQRHPVSDSVAVLTLGAGRWTIAVTRDGLRVGEMTPLTVIAGEVDTLRIGTGMPRGDIP